MTNDFLVIIRTVSERSEGIAKQLILEQGVSVEKIVVINEIPFTRAIEMMLRVGLEFNKKWTLVIDADVLCCSNSIERMLDKMEELPDNIFEIQGFVLDKFFGGIRTAGNHLYRTSHFKMALDKFFPLPDDLLRPESYLIEKLNELGYTWKRVPIIIGVHDYEQSYEDIYRKSFIHGRKSLGYVELLMDTWKTGIQNGDKDFDIAMHGFIAGLKSLQFVSIDKGSNIIKESFEKLDLIEKLPLPNHSVNLKYVDLLIINWLPSEIYKRFIPRLKTEFLFPVKIQKQTYKDRINEKWNSVSFFSFVLFMIGFLIKKVGQRIENLSK